MLNNAFRTIAKPAVRSHKRLMTSQTFVKADKQYSFQKAWLSDPATYPLILVLGAAGALCSGFGVYFLASSNDVQLSPTKRNSVLRTWGKE